MNSKFLHVLLLLIMVTFTVTSFAQVDPSTRIPPDVDDSGGAGSSACHCSEPRCGCANAPVGYVLTYNCACGTETCTRSCVYSPL